MQPLQLTVVADQVDIGIKPAQQSVIALAHSHVRGRIPQLELQLNCLELHEAHVSDAYGDDGRNVWTIWVTCVAEARILVIDHYVREF